ncbi:MAG TPA: ABC transporter substrate-binding protein [Candidatus Binatia bacterium]|jgi:ABC-type nitrate/sulfonate/bicarbonate transport system substrate-binding protein|nr:ABC transporter substrate-binding protein [Candidatus Binatia bacterium]
MLRIAVPDLVSNSYFPAIAAVELGFFKSQGYDARIDLLFPIPKTFEALRDGQLDFVVGSAHATLLAFPQWKGAKLLATVGQHTYWFLVIRSDLKPQRGDLSIVRGLRIGAAPGVNLSLHRMLVEAGIDPERNGVQIMPIPGAAGPNVSFGLSAAKALEDGKLDGFWANGMGCEVAVRRGVGTMVLDVRRGDGPTAARHYTFSALVATEKRINDDPQSAIAAIRALMRAHRALRDDVSRATAVGKKRFPPSEAELIAELVRRDLPYYDPTIPREKVASMNRFARDIGLLSGSVSYEDVVATQFSHLWSEAV